MPRTKAAPSRKRPLDDDDVAAAPAVPTDDEVAQLVEDAEISALSARIADGSCREHVLSDAEPEGLVRLALSDAIIGPLRELHESIKRRVGALTGWGGKHDASGRLRGYGYLAASQLARRHYEASHAMREYDGEAADADREANKRASILLAEEELPEGLHSALALLTEQLRPLLEQQQWRERRRRQLADSGGGEEKRLVRQQKHRARQLDAVDDETAARVGLDRGGAVRKEPVNAAAHLLTQGLEAASVAEDVVSVPAMRRVAAGRAAAAAAGAQRAEGDARRSRRASSEVLKPRYASSKELHPRRASSNDR